MTAQSEPERRRREMCRHFAPLWVGLLLAGVTFFIYLPTARFEFVHYDDFEYVVNNPHVQHGLTWAGVAWAFGNGYASNWHPLTWLSHMLDVTLFGQRAGGHHLTNVVFHCLNTVLLFLALRRLSSRTVPKAEFATTGLESRTPDAGLRTPDTYIWHCAFVAGFFALHPLHVESVAWVSERKDVLSGFFFFLTLWAYAKYVSGAKGQVSGSTLDAIRNTQHVSAPRPLTYGFYWLALFCFALGLMSKPMLVTLPCVLLLLDYWPLGRFSPSTASRLLWEKLPFFALTIASSIVTFAAQREGGSVSGLADFSFPMRLASAVMSYAFYVLRTFWPADLAVLYPRPEHWPLAQWAGAAAALLAVTALVVWRGRRWPFAAVGWFWFGGMLVPVIGLVQVGMQFRDDRYTYLPLIGLFMAMTWGAGAVAMRWPRMRLPLAALGLLALAACAVVTRAQSRFWADSEALFGRAVAVTHNNYIARNNLGMALARKGQMDDAIRHFEETVRFAPKYPAPHNNLGNIAAMQGRMAEAMEHFRNAIRLDTKPFDAQNNLGNALVAQNRLAEAEAAYAAALRSKSDYAPARFGLGKLWLQQGRVEEAQRELEAALQSDPMHAEAHHRLAAILSGRKQFAEAIAHYREAVRLKPDWVVGLNSLAWILATHSDAQFRNGAEAVRAAERAVELTKRADAQVLDTLAAAYAEAGRFAEAVSTARTAAELAATGNDPNLVKELQGRLELYQAQRPFHQ